MSVNAFPPISSRSWVDAYRSGGDKAPRPPGYFAKIAERLDAVARARLLKGAARGIEVEDTVPESKAHPGHMTNIESNVIEEMLRQRAKKKMAEGSDVFFNLAQGGDPDDIKVAMAYLLSLPEGETILKTAIEQGEFLADKLAEENPELAAAIAKTAIEFSAIKPLISSGTQTALDLERASGPYLARQAAGRAALLAPLGYVAGSAMGDTPEKKHLYGKMGLGAGLGTAGLGAVSSAKTVGKELEALKLLERGTKTPGATAATVGTSLSREEAIRGAAKNLLKEQAPKTAEWDWQERHVIPTINGEPMMHGNVIKIADDGQTRSYIMGLDRAAPGSMATFLDKTAQAGWLRPILSSAEGVPWGRMAAGAAAGGFAGSLMTPAGSKNEGRNALLGAVGGAGLVHGMSPGAVKGVEGAAAGAGGAFRGSLKGSMKASALLSPEARAAARYHGASFLNANPGRTVDELVTGMKSHAELGQFAQTPTSAKSMLQHMSDEGAVPNYMVRNASGKYMQLGAHPDIAGHTIKGVANASEQDLVGELSRKGVNMSEEMRSALHPTAKPEDISRVHGRIYQGLLGTGKTPEEARTLASTLMHRGGVMGTENLSQITELGGGGPAFEKMQKESPLGHGAMLHDYGAST